VNFSLGKAIKELRAAKDITQAELAERVGVTMSAISSYEVSGRLPSYDVLVKIARVFNVTTDFLLGMGKKDVIDVTGLSIQQRETISRIVSEYKDFNGLRSSINAEQKKSYAKWLGNDYEELEQIKNDRFIGIEEDEDDDEE